MQQEWIRHEIPTHLQVEDKAIFGLTLWQVFYLLGGVTAVYAIYVQWSFLPLSWRAVLAAIVSVLTLLVTLVRPQGRDLLDWGLCLVRYAALPKRAVWKPRSWAPPARREREKQRQQVVAYSQHRLPLGERVGGGLG